MPRLPIFDQDEFIEKYNHFKSKGLLEKEIASEMYVGTNTLYLYKKKYGIPLITKENKELVNENGLTREWLKIAKRNGLDSSLVNARIRELNWSVEDACTIGALSMGTKIMKKGERKNVIK